jgi:hypothetical protein
VNPTRGPIAGAKLSSPDALAATFTPEFERVPASQLATAPRRRRVWPLALGGGMIVAAGGVAAFLMLNKAPATPSAVPAPAVTAPAAAPVAAPTPVEKVPAAESPPVEATPEPVPAATPAADDVVLQPQPTKRPKTQKARAGSPATTPAKKDPGDAPPAKGDIIHLGSDTFGKDP